MIILYQRTDCPFCWKVRIALAELQIEYKTIDIQLGEKHPTVVAMSPTGTVPVLIDGEISIWESSVILDYLDRKYSLAHLVPSEPVEESRIRLLHAYSDKIVGSCLKDLVFEKRSKPEHEWDKRLIQKAEIKWQNCLTWLEEQLGGQMLFGSQYSAADCALAARFGVAEAYGVPVSERFAGLFKWYNFVSSRASWTMAYPTSFIRAK